MLAMTLARLGLGLHLSLAVPVHASADLLP
jgi:hypothetical protein